jgi:hypothetical protein
MTDAAEPQATRPDPATTSGSEPDDAEFMRRLEALVLKLLRKRVRSPRGFWKLQLDLLALEREVQKAIAWAKADQAPDSYRKLRDFRGTLWQARRFGDAIAWLMFKGDRRQIYPLSENSKVPVPPDDHGSRGVIGVAQAMYPKYGFPILHDITDILRVGDVSFIKPDEPPLTVEIKTTVVDDKTDGKVRTINLNATAIWPQPEASGHPRSDRRPPQPRQAAMSSPRFHRQLERLSAAQLLRGADAGSTAVVSGRKTMIVEPPGSRPTSHWPLISRLVRRARRYGYACGVADKAVFYLVMYDRSGVGARVADSVSSDLLASGILFLNPEDTQRNSLWVVAMPEPGRDGPLRYQPYFLYPLPQSWIVDLLHGRLVIVACLNIGRVAASLEEAGFATEDQGGGQFPFVFHEWNREGCRWRGSMPSIGEHLTEMVMEGMSLDYVVDLAKAVAKAMEDHVPSFLEEEKARRDKCASTQSARIDTTL